MPKKALGNRTTERLGVNLVEKRVLEMGFLWEETGGVDSGVDGTIELRQPDGTVANVRIGVQVKARGSQKWPAEHADSFSFHVDDDDRDYWREGNTPTILVCCRPEKDEAYWIDISGWARDPSNDRTKTVHLDKRRDRFDAAAADRIRLLCADTHPDMAGGTIADKAETLLLNLMPVEHIEPVLLTAKTIAAFDKRRAGDLLAAAGKPPRKGWIARNGQLLTLNPNAAEGLSPLTTGNWTQVPTDDWAYSHDRDRRNAFADLLLKTLRDQQHRALAFNGRYLYFKASENLEPIKIRWGRGTGLTVFSPYSYRSDSGTSFYRHNAARVRFVYLDGRWYGQIEPTYHFTSDGHQEVFAADNLATIKRRERSPAVRDALRMWSFKLSEKPSLFGTPALQLGACLELPCDVGIHDADWRRPDGDRDAPGLLEAA